MSLKGKTIVVTGGSRGLGLGLVEALVQPNRGGDDAEGKARHPSHECGGECPNGKQNQIEGLEIGHGIPHHEEVNRQFENRTAMLHSRPTNTPVASYAFIN
jgi:NAD(P)-dependent dehydrogenase (short-subunit alcohol dehydrogenase family)